MTITLPTDLAQAVAEDARKRGVAPEDAAQAALRERFLPGMPFGGTEDTLDEWELEISAAAVQVEAVTAALRKDDHA